MCVGQGVATCLDDGSAWGNPVPCPPDTECHGGQCEDVQAIMCKDVLYCMFQLNCGSAAPDCFPQCFEGASAVETGQAKDVYDCVFKACGKWGPGEACFVTQQITGCAAEFEACEESSPCVPQCGNKECGGDGCGGSCGGCPAGQKCNDSGKCVSTGQGCDGINWQGCCKGETLHYCDDNKLHTEDCSQQPYCGWKQQAKYYDCGSNGGSDPSGKHPKNCPGECTPACAGKQCGPDGCGGSCGNCPGGYSCNQSGQCTAPDGDSCSEMVQCAFDCNFAQNCLWDCYEGGNPQSQQLLENLGLCIAQACNWQISEQCIWDAVGSSCQQAYQACTADQ